VRKPSSLIITSHTVRPKWPRYGNLLEVVDGNWMLPGFRKNHEVLEDILVDVMNLDLTV
jgi:hypothetical protein